MTNNAEEIDLGGDVFVRAGPKGSQVRLKVLSSLLALVSQYFRTLFGSRFREGQDAANGKDITLHDDDPKAFTLLCKIIHMQYTPPPQPLSSDEMLNVAFVVDKYDCVKAVALAMNSIFPPLDPTATFVDRCKYASAAYLLDRYGDSQMLTESLMLGRADSVAEVTALSRGQHLPIQASGESRRPGH